jgi:hypothetical protein
VNARARALFALLALLAACSSTSPCKTDTLLLSVEMGPAHEQAARVSVRVSGADNQLLSSGEVERPAGQRSGTIEVRFAGGYPAGEVVFIQVEARRGNELVASASMSTPLAPGCSALTLSLASPDARDAGADASTADRSSDAALDAEPSADGAGDAFTTDTAGTTDPADAAPSPPDATDAGATDANPPSDAPPAGMARRVFVTSSRHTGNIGGLPGAHAICQALADAAGLGGTYKAWLSSGLTGPASTMIHSTVPYLLVNGQKVADNWNDLTDGSLRHAIDRDEHGRELQPEPFVCDGGEVWSNTTPTGAPLNALNDCVGWTSTSGTSNNGDLHRSDERWTEGDCANTTCLSDLPFYCFEQ